MKFTINFQINFQIRTIKHQIKATLKLIADGIKSYIDQLVILEGNLEKLKEQLNKETKTSTNTGDKIITTMRIEYKGMILGKHCININGNCFYYDYNIEKYNALNFREDTEEGMSKIMARTYKSFKAKLGIKHYQDCNNLVVDLHKAKLLKV